MTEEKHESKKHGVTIRIKNTWQISTVILVFEFKYEFSDLLGEFLNLPTFIGFIERMDEYLNPADSAKFLNWIAADNLCVVTWKIGDCAKKYR